MNALATFAFGEQIVRVADQAGEPWFVGRDVCLAMGHTNPAKSLARLPEDEKGVTNGYTLGGMQEMIIISEPGMYRLVLTSRTEAAERFKKWVVAEVLPSIRRTGRYEMEAPAGPPAAADVDHDTAEGRLSLASRLELVRLALRVHGRLAARRAWDMAGLPCLLPERAEEELVSIEQTVRDWMAERLQDAANGRARSSALYADYSRWCRMQNIGFISHTRFSRSLSEAGLRSVKSSCVHWLGVALRPAGQGVALPH